MFIAFSPIRYLRATNSYYNMNDKNRLMRGELKGNSGVIRKFSKNYPGKYLDNLKNFIPLLLFVPYLPSPYREALLRKALKISKIQMQLQEKYSLLSAVVQPSIFSASKEDSISTSSAIPPSFNKQMKAFVRYFGYIFPYLDSKSIDIKIIKLLISIMQMNSTLSKKLLKIMALNVNTWVNFEITILAIFSETMKAIYARDVGYFSKFIKLRLLLQIMSNMSSSLNSSHVSTNQSSVSTVCCANKLYQRFECILSFLKFIFINDKDNASNNISELLYAMSHCSPCHCLFISLINFLSDLCENSPTYILALDSRNSFVTLMSLAKNYNISTQLACARLIGIIMRNAKKYRISLSNFKLHDTIRCMNLWFSLFNKTNKEENSMMDQCEEKKEIMPKISHGISMKDVMKAEDVKYKKVITVKRSASLKEIKKVNQGEKKRKMSFTFSDSLKQFLNPNKDTQELVRETQRIDPKNRKDFIKRLAEYMRKLFFFNNTILFHKK